MTTLNQFEPGGSTQALLDCQQTTHICILIIQIFTRCVHITAHMTPEFGFLPYEQAHKSITQTHIDLFRVGCCEDVNDE